MATASYQKIELTGNVTLYFPFYTPSGQLSITDRIEVNPDQADREITLPNATQAQKGSYFIFNNIGNYSFKLMLNDGTTELVEIGAGEVKYITINDNSTTNGDWSVLPFGGGQGAITSVVATSSNDALVVTGSPLSSPGGTLDFEVSGSLFNFNNIDTTGVPVVLSNNPSTYTTRTLVAGSNIEISNNDGVAGNPTIAVNNTISNLSSLGVGDITFSNTTITNNAANGNINITTNGTGVVSLNGVTIDDNKNISDINNITMTGAFNNPYLPRAWGVFTDTDNGGVSTIVLESSQNITSVTGSNGTYVVNFTNPMSTINYGVQMSLGSNGSVQPPTVYQAFWISRQLNSVSIAVVDAAGEFVQSVPDGLTITIME